MRCPENRDVVGEKCVRMNNGMLTLSVSEKKESWKCHYDRLLNMGSEWEKDSLPNIKAIE